LVYFFSPHLKKVEVYFFFSSLKETKGAYMTVIILGVILSFNLIIIYYKATHDRVGDAILDATTLVLLATVFGGSTQSLTVATIASAIISIYLLFALRKK